MLIPHCTLDKLLSSVSPRAVSVLVAILRRFNGFNNGAIAISRRELGEAIGSKCTSASARAIAELEQGGFIWQTHFPKGQRKASEFGVTFITSGPDGDRAATHLYLGVEKSRGWKNDIREAAPVAESDTRGKHRVSENATGATETSGLSSAAPVSETAPHIVSHARSQFDLLGNSSKDSPKSPGPASGMDLVELRAFCRSYLNQADAGAQSRLAVDAQIPGGTLSKFLGGRSLPVDYRMALQLAVARAFPVAARGDWHRDGQADDPANRNQRPPGRPISEADISGGATAADLGIDLRPPPVGRTAAAARDTGSGAGASLAPHLPASFNQLPLGDKIEHLDRAYKSIGRDPKALTAIDMMTFGRELYACAEAHRDSPLGQRAQRLFEEMSYG